MDVESVSTLSIPLTHKDENWTWIHCNSIQNALHTTLCPGVGRVNCLNMNLTLIWLVLPTNEGQRVPSSSTAEPLQGVSRPISLQELQLLPRLELVGPNSSVCSQPPGDLFSKACPGKLTTHWYKALNEGPNLSLDQWRQDHWQASC